MVGRILACAAALVIAGPALAGLEDITNLEAIAGLKAALDKGSRAAVDTLGKVDGFFGNAQVKIPLPESLARAERLMRRLGMGKYADELVLTMNRAAETAVQEAKPLFVDSIKQMTVKDAKGILTGGETSATEYFKRTTSDPLRKRFLPIVKGATSKVKLADKYNRYADQAADLGLIDEKDADLDGYVTQKALDGLFFMVAEEEKKIRKDPVGTANNILKKVFGALKS